MLLALMIAVTGCSSDNDFSKGKKLLEDQGYTEVVNTGHSFFCCDEKDTYSTGFKCKDKQGNEVEGCFCSSLTKGVTIRYE
jgi:hypothetical protein